MFAVADSTFDLFILQLRFHAVLLRLLLLAVFLPRHARSEDDVFADAGGVEARAYRVALFEAEFGPTAALGHARVDGFFDDGGTDPASGFHLLAIIIEAV